ncbi:MAG: hypothetical protein OEV06_07405, partial [Anaerolineae bacterium]|nr:hypothetical protein [Anaerolineae bacterium]
PPQQEIPTPSATPAASPEPAALPSDSAPVPPEIPPISLPITEKPESQERPKPILSPPSRREGPLPSARLATIFIRSSGDNARDILRIRRIYGMLISYPGNDRFSFYVNESKHGHFLEFPNDTTNLNDELQSRLEDLLGRENVQIEDITFQ